MLFTIKGYACRFNKQDAGKDIIASTIFHTTALPSPDAVKMLYQHDITRPVGRWTHFKVDSQGLYAEGIIYRQVPDGETLAVLLEHQIIDGLSIGFITHDYYIRKDGVRVLTSIELKEISLVTFPMQEGARLLPERKEQNGSFEALLSAWAGDIRVG